VKVIARKKKQNAVSDGKDYGDDRRKDPFCTKRWNKENNNNLFPYSFTHSHKPSTTGDPAAGFSRTRMSHHATIVPDRDDDYDDDDVDAGG
jgi:hypothetical protein